jgi:hypothetical protein
MSLLKSWLRRTNTSRKRRPGKTEFLVVRLRQVSVACARRALTGDTGPGSGPHRCVFRVVPLRQLPRQCRRGLPMMRLNVAAGSILLHARHERCRRFSPRLRPALLPNARRRVRYVKISRIPRIRGFALTARRSRDPRRRLWKQTCGGERRVRAEEVNRYTRPKRRRGGLAAGSLADASGWYPTPPHQPEASARHACRHAQALTASRSSPDGSRMCSC